MKLYASLYFIVAACMSIALLAMGGGLAAALGPVVVALMFIIVWRECGWI